MPATVLVIHPEGLASSLVGVGVQSDMVDISASGFGRIKVYAKITMNASVAATANTGVYFYALRGDLHAVPHRTDGAALAAAGLTVLNAPQIGQIRLKGTPVAGDVLYTEFDMVAPGAQFGLAIVHNTGQALHATPTNHYVHWIGLTN